MADKAILDVDLGTAEFKKFIDLFNQYSKLMKDTSDSWTKIAKQIEGANKSTRLLASAFSAMASHTKSIAGNLLKATASLMKWGTIVGAVTGLLGASGGLWGIGRMASNMLNQQRSTLGLGPVGANAGLYNAFTLNYARLMNNPAGLVDAVSAAQTNAASPQRGALIGLGLAGRSELAKDPTQIAIDVMNKLAKDMSALPAGERGMYAQRFQGLGISENDLNAWLNATKEQRAEIEKQTAADRAALDISKAQMDAWAKLTLSLQRAGATIGTLLTVKLTALAGPLSKLSASLLKLIAAVVNSPLVKKVIDDLSKWINDLATSINDSGLDKKVAEWGKALASFYDGIKKTAGKFKEIIDAAAALISVFTGWRSWLIKTFHLDGFAGMVQQNNMSALGAIAGAAVGGGGGGGGGAIAGAAAGGGGGGDTGAPPDLSNTVRTKDMPPEAKAFLDLIASGESKGEYNILNGGGHFGSYGDHPGGRAAGRYQFLPSTWRVVKQAIGAKDFSPENQDKGAWWLAVHDYHKVTGRDLMSDLKSGNVNMGARALGGTWLGLHGRGKIGFDKYFEKEKGAVKATAPPPAVTPTPDPLPPLTMRGRGGDTLGANSLGNFQMADRQAQLVIRNQTGGQPAIQGAMLAG